MKILTGSNIRSYAYSYGNITEYFITAQFASENDTLDVITDILNLLDKYQIEPVYGFGFGGNRQHTDIINFLSMMSKNVFPLTWSESYDNPNHKVDGIFIKGLHGAAIQPVFKGANCCGNWYEDDFATYVYLGNLVSGN